MASKKGHAVAAANTPQAVDDLFAGLTEDQSGASYLDVLLNDRGGNAKSLHSLGGETSAQGASISITADGKVAYDASSLDLSHLKAGEVFEDTFTYAIQLGKGVLSWATATVRITGVNDAPVIVAPNGGDPASLAVTENTTAVSDVDATDAEGDALSYSIVPLDGTDFGAFTIDADTGALSFASAPDFDNPGDLGGDNSYQVVVQVSDGAETDTQAISVQVLNDPADNVPTVPPPPGGPGNDTLVGTNNADAIVGGLGADLLTGNGGTDVFLYTLFLDSTPAASDTITDFNGVNDAGTDDRIVLTPVDADLFLPGNQDFIWSGETTSTALGSVNWYLSGGNTIVQADVNGIAGADFQIILNGAHSLTPGDFLL